MSSTILVCGHGPGISDAVARRWGRAGHAVAIVARNGARLAEAEKSLAAAGVKAKAFATDLSNVAAVREMVRSARAALGPIGVIHWNAYQRGAADLLASPTDELAGILDVCVIGLVAAVQEAHADLKANKGAVLVTGGGLCLYDPKIDKMATSWGAAGLAIGKAAQHKTVGLLGAKLEPDGVYVGEVVVTGTVKGTAFDTGNGTIDPATIAEKFWQLAQARTEASVIFG